MDDVYRNTNGISFQLMSMASAYEKKNMGKPASKLFLKIAELYYNDRTSFISLRNEAMQMAEFTSDLKYEFTKYISEKQITSANCNRILSALQNIENFAISTQALPCSIFENFNSETISILRKKVLAHKSFAVRYNNILKYAETSVAMLEDFFITLQNEANNTNSCTQVFNNGDIMNKAQVSSHFDNDSIKASFMTWLTNEGGVADATARSYTSCINTADRIVREQNISDKGLWNVEDKGEAKDILDKLMTNDAFIKMNDKAHNSLTVGVKKYLLYIIQSGMDNDSNLKKDLNLTSEIRNKLDAILSQEFEDGYRIGDYMHRMRFLSSFEENYGEEFSGELDETLKSIGQVRNGRIFCGENVDNTLLSYIYEDLEQVFSNGATIVYYECLFEKYGDKLVAEMSIYTVDTLKTVLQDDNRYNQKYRFIKIGISKYGANPDTNSEIRKLLRNSHLPMTFDDIKTHLWYVTIEQIKRSCVQIPECVCVDEGTYFYAPNFYISTEERTTLIRAMRSTIASRGYLVAKDLREVFKNICPSAAIDSERYKDHAIREILSVLLQDSFTFSSSVITEKGITLDYGEIFRNYAAECERVSLAELDLLKDELGLPGIYWLDVFKEVTRINKTEMVRKGTVQFDATAIDQRLDEMCPDEYTPLKDFTLFLNLPPTSVRWNGFLLESYLREYSERFCLVQVSVSKDDYYGLMLRRDSHLETYDDIVADMLAKSDQWSDERSALRLLVNMKFQQRARYRNIGDLIKRARMIRINLEERR